MQGQLGEKLISNLIRQIAHLNGTGLLRLTNGKAMKAIFFEGGNPVFAISNLNTEQLEHRLLKEGHATFEQLQQAKQAGQKATQLAKTLVETGALSQEQMHKAVRDLAIDIVFSLFEWDQGEYTFDERIRASHEVRFEWSAEDCILEGARHAALVEKISETLLPEDSEIEQANLNGKRLNFSGKPNPVESYVFSRVETATSLNDLCLQTGLGEAATRQAVCALVAVGLLKRVGFDDDEAEVLDTEKEEAIEELRREISRRLHFFATADHYEVLGSTRRSTPAEMKSAYYKLAKQFHPDRYRHHEELRLKLEAVFSKISQAYETLSDPRKRAEYDEHIRKNPVPKAVTERMAPEAPAIPLEIKLPSNPSQPLRASKPLGSVPLPPPTAIPQVEPPPASKPAAPAASQAVATASAGSGQSAEYYYLQGRARFDQRDYFGAVNLFREAVKRDPNQAHYHYHLGNALVRNQRTRRDGEHHLLKAAELDPFNPHIRVKLGLLYKEAKMAKKAEHFFREAVRLDPANRAALKELKGGRETKDDSSLWKSDLGTVAKKLFKK